MLNKILDAKRLKSVFSEDSSTMDSLTTYVSVLSFCFRYICYCLVLCRSLCCLGLKIVDCGCMTWQTAGQLHT